ncbi:MAG: MMPL family transporter [Planctomycetaceae bacterium]
MFPRLGQLVTTHWRWVLAFWAALFAASVGLHARGYDRWLGPGVVKNWLDVAQDGEFTFLPAEMQSLTGEKLLGEAFPEDLLRSSVVVVVRRYQQPLEDDDYVFLREVLIPGLKEIQNLESGDASLEIKSPEDRLMGPLLRNESGNACLVIVPLKDEFLAWANVPVIRKIETWLTEELPQRLTAGGKPVIPAGLDLALSGSATVGRDMLLAAQESAAATERWTVVLVVLLLAAIYRAPLLALIPLLTVMVSVEVSLALLILLTQVPPTWLLGWKYTVFVGMEVYITVVVYGTGVDYCLFLIARYKEELDKGHSVPRALAESLGMVGAALTASAFTVICGIGMMVFAKFGKFREAGVGIGLALLVGFVASLTLTPALLRLMGRVAFWPHGRSERIETPGWGTRMVNRLIPYNRFQIFWDYVGDLVLRRPGAVLLTSFLLMLPLAGLGLGLYDYLSYGLLSELPPGSRSVVGAKAVQEHFPAGYAGPLTILIKNPDVDFNSSLGRAGLAHLCAGLQDRSEELAIADLRSLLEPLGQGASLTPFQKGVGRKKSEKYYVSSVEPHAGHVTRIDVVFRTDPFDRESIRLLNEVEQQLRRSLTEPHDAEEEELLQPLRQSELYFVGPTGSIRDLKIVTDGDQLKIDLLVLGAVFLILVVLLRRPGISIYLIVSVFFSYFAALGATFAVFWLMDPSGFAGLDWKVPMFLFTILIAIGEDYNIFLMTRIDEEQRVHGEIEGVRVAMRRTGTIISSCGIIMAGTFLSLFAGTLVGLKQLGFALAFGVLLDTFVVRPLLVPAFLVLLYRNGFGRRTAGSPPAENSPA